MQTERTAKVAQLIAEGLDYKEIGVLFAMTAERIRQLHRQHIDSSPRKDAIRAREKATLSQFRTIQRDLFRAFRSAQHQRASFLCWRLSRLIAKQPITPPETKPPSRIQRNRDRAEAIAVAVPILPGSTMLNTIPGSGDWARPLNAAGIHTVEDAHRYRVSNLVKLRGFGGKRRDMLLLAVYGL